MATGGERFQSSVDIFCNGRIVNNTPLEVVNDIISFEDEYPCHFTLKPDTKIRIYKKENSIYLQLVSVTAGIPFNVHVTFKDRISFDGFRRAVKSSGRENDEYATSSSSSSSTHSSRSTISSSSSAQGDYAIGKYNKKDE